MALARTRLAIRLALVLALSATGFAQSRAVPDWQALEPEILRHFQALLRLDTSSPPGNETRAVEYLKGVLEKEGIPVQVFALEPDRANLVARIKGNGRKRPLLLTGHTDVVSVDAAKWKFPPFSATRDGGYIYGRGTLDDKPHVLAGLMDMLLVKRLGLSLDRDVIFLAEAGEEGGSNVGINFMIDSHFQDIDAEYCLAEGGGVVRTGGKPQMATIQVLEKHARTIELVATGPSGHASAPLQGSAIVHLATAVASVTSWQPPVRINETTATYLTRLAGISPPDLATRYRAVLKPETPEGKAAFEYFLKNQPSTASMLHTSISPTIISGGYRVNIIPSEAKATLDVRMVPDDEPDQFLVTLRKIVNDPSVDVHFAARVERPRSTQGASLASEAYKVIESALARHYDTVVMPVMSTGGSDMAQMRAKGIQCLGIGPAADSEDAVQGYGMHGDQERILESEIYRFVRFQWDAVKDLAATK
jgi:acetylornithine deacetylase/succinyl-diaminopimelate desuccinylase-like protein